MTEKQLYTRVKIITVSSVVVIVLLLLYILIQSIVLSNLGSSKERLQNQLNVLNSRTQDLEEEIKYRNSRTYIEQYARENLGLCYSDEYKYKAQE